MIIDSETLVKVQALKDKVLHNYDSVYRSDISILDPFKNYGFYIPSIYRYIPSLFSLDTYMIYKKDIIICACNAILKNKLYKFEEIKLTNTVKMLLYSDDIESFNLGKSLLPKNCYVKAMHQVGLVPIKKFSDNDIFFSFYTKEKV